MRGPRAEEHVMPEAPPLAVQFPSPALSWADALTQALNPEAQIDGLSSATNKPGALLNTAWELFPTKMDFKS